MKTRRWLSRGEKEVLPTKSITRVPSTLRLFSRLHGFILKSGESWEDIDSDRSYQCLRPRRGTQCLRCGTDIHTSKTISSDLVDTTQFVAHICSTVTLLKGKEHT